MSSNAHKQWTGYMCDVISVCQAILTRYGLDTCVVCYRYVSNAQKLWIGYMHDVLSVYQANAHKQWTGISVMCYRYAKQC